DDVRRDTDRRPTLAVLVLTLDQDAGDGPGSAIEDTNAIVRQPEALNKLLVLAEVLAQRDVERIDGTIALAGGDQHFARNIHLHDGHRHRDPLAERVVALLDIDVELLNAKVLRHNAKRAPCQQLE